MATGFMDRFKGKIKASIIYLDSAATKGIFLNAGSTYVQSPNVWTNAGAPTSGGSGTLAGYAGPGDLLVDTTDFALYMNTNTLASPTWTAFESSGGAGSFTTLQASGLTTLAGVGSSIPKSIYAANTGASGTVTLTAAQCTGASDEMWINCTGTQAGAFAIDLPTVGTIVTASVAAGVNLVAGGTFYLNIMNNCGAVQTGTVTTAAGWTLTGNMTATNGTYRRLLVTVTSLSAFAAQSLGEYTIAAAV